MELPTTPGLYEADAYPLSDGYNGYMLSEDGRWYEVQQWDANLTEFDLKDIEAIAPMRPLMPANGED